MKIHVKILPMEEYARNEPNRLDVLEDNQLYQLMMRRANGSGAEAMRAPVYVKQLETQLAQTAFAVTFTDKDLQPAHKRGVKSQLVDRYWMPSQPIPLKSKKVDGSFKVGYFMPYEDEFDLDLLIATGKLSESIIA